jgi:3-dehydroquinate dehydratase-1
MTASLPDGPLAFEEFVLAAVTDDLSTAGGERAAEHADCVEFRMDLASAVGRDPLAALADYEGPLPVLATNRVAWEGGDAEGPERLEDLRVAAEHPRVRAVDVELSSVAGDGEGIRTAEHARDHGASVVVSTHDFEATPARPEMERLLRRACEAGDVGKLAVTADDSDDALDLLGLTRARAAAGDRVATMAMGAAGRHTRAVAPVYGSRIGYAPVDPDDATAPGQYDLATLRELVDQLRHGE